VFCGSNAGRSPAFASAARDLGTALAAAGLGLVYGGGDVGLMGVLADTVLDAGGEVIGVIPEALLAKELGHRGCTELRVVGSMHERKAMMADLADGFVALPGGLGTFEELCEVLTWSQLGFHAKPVVLLDVEEFWTPFLRLLDTAVAAGFLRAEHRALAVRAASAPEALGALAAPRPPAPHKWIDRDET
jgi:uncharacterized protein (TIGR00730 family)